MVPSPRKSATRPAFNQTWDESDAAFLDPNTLPVARIPRGWERRQQTKKTEQGKEKTIWRRFNLRSRAPDAPEEEEEVHDARSRPVKKLQQMSPKAMEKSGTGRQGKKRAFKATRWDRRKSVLPRKNTTRVGSTAEPQDVSDMDDSQDLETEEPSEVTNTDLQEHKSRVDEFENLIPDGENRRSAFTFTVSASDEQTVLQDEQIADPDPVDDVTITNLFRSPMKDTSFEPDLNSLVEYPQLPDMDLDTANDMTELATPTPNLHVDHNAGSEREAVDTIVHTGCPVSSIAETEFVEAVNGVVASPKVGSEHASAAQAEDNTDGTAVSSPSPREVSYPDIPELSSPISEKLTPAKNVDSFEEDAEMSDIHQDDELDAREVAPMTLEKNMNNCEEEVAAEEFTEASLQLNFQRDGEGKPQQEQPDQQDARSEDVVDTAETVHMADSVQGSSIPCLDDITDGLTLSFTPARTASAEPTPRKLHSPPPPPRTQSGPDDVTVTIALDDDTALLKDFLSRAAASKAEKAAVLTHRRESLQNRRDSDVIRHALASPRKALEDKDPNSPSKVDQEITLDLSQTLTLNMDGDAALDEAEAEDTAEGRSSRGSRRSSRTKKSRLPAPASAAQAQASKIAIRRADGTEHVVLKKSDAQELATLTRTNTRKNKQGAFGVTVRLLKLAVDAANLPPVDDSTKELVVGKNVRWDQQLTYYQENPETIAERESLATPDELSLGEPSSTKKPKVSKNSTPKVRRVRGLGTANGTPGKGLLEPVSLLPDAVQDEKEAIQEQASKQQLPRPRSGKVKKMSVASSTDSSTTTKPKSIELPTLEVAPVGIEPAKERKSRLAAPKKVVLPQPVVAVPAEGKENPQRTGISAATPKKGIPAPKIVVPPTVGMESGLPRRRGRRV